MKKSRKSPCPSPTTERTGEAQPFHTQRYLFQSSVFDVEFFCIDKIKQLPVLLPVGGDAQLPDRQVQREANHGPGQTMGPGAPGHVIQPNSSEALGKSLTLVLKEEPVQLSRVLRKKRWGGVHRVGGGCQGRGCHLLTGLYFILHRCYED